MVYMLVILAICLTILLYLFLVVSPNIRKILSYVRATNTELADINDEIAKIKDVLEESSDSVE